MPIANGIYYTVSGKFQSNALPVILIHGAGSSHLCWRPEIRRLGDYPIYAIDLPGHGKSDGVGLQSIEAYAARLHSFLDHLNIYQVILFGYSMRAAIALQCALTLGTRIRGIGLAAGAAKFDIPAEILLGLQNQATYSQALAQIEAHLFSPDSLPALVEESIQFLRQARPGVLYGDFLACSKFDVRHRLPEINIPAWIVSGSLDRLVSPMSARYLASHLAQADLQIVSGGTHAIIFESPTLIQRGLTRLIHRVELRQ